MVFLDNREIRSGRFLIFKDVKARASEVISGDIFRELWHGFTYHRSEISIEKCKELVFCVGDVDVPEAADAEYAINVQTSGFAVSSRTEAGLKRGFMTLLDRIHPTDDDGAVAYLDCCEFSESPRIGVRMVHFCVFPETELFHLRRFLRFAAALKYTHVIVEFWGMVKLDCFPELAWQYAFSKDDVHPIFDEARALGVEIVPMFNHWGHASQSRSIHGKHVVLDQNPTLVTYFEEGGWCWKISDRRVRELFVRIRDELMELAGDGEYFHIGCDEADGYDMNDPVAREAICDFLNEIADDLGKHGRRPIMWADMLIYKYPEYNIENKYYCAAPSEECEKYVFSKLDKRIVMADWQYLPIKAPVETSLKIKSYGRDCMTCPFDFGVPKLAAAQNTVAEYGLMGFIHTTWHRLSTGMHFVAMAAAGGYAELPKNETEVVNNYRVSAADTLRKVLSAEGVYEHSGWSKNQVGSFIT